MKIFSVDQVKTMENELVKAGFSTQKMIAKIGELASEEILNWANTFDAGQIKRFLVFCGAGNNGADGFAIAQALHEAEANVVVFVSTSSQKLSANAAFFAKKMDDHIPVHSNGVCTKNLFEKGDCIIDCMLGTGCKSDLKEPFFSYCKMINELDFPVLSIDVPTGLNAQNGESFNHAIRADITLVCGWMKEGLLFKKGPLQCGKIKILSLNLDDTQNEVLSFYALEDAQRMLSRKNSLSFDTYKYSQGIVSIIAGSQTFSGAASLCAESSLRMGAGLTHLITADACRFNHLPNAIITHYKSSDNQGFINVDAENVLKDVHSSNVFLIGSGLGVTPSTKILFEKTLDSSLSPKKVVIDASGILLFCSSENKMQLICNKEVIFTPHIGEAKLLAQSLDIFIPENLNDTQSRIDFATQLACVLKSIVVLKGHRTICASPCGKITINGSGTPALATAGTGDVLAGMIAGFWASSNSKSLLDIASFSVFTHGFLSENTSSSMRGLIADDLVELISPVLKMISPFA